MTDWTAPSRLHQEWVLCAIAAAAARFIPVPLADDLVKERATRTAVSRTWQAHHRPPAPRVIDTLSGDTTGFFAGLGRSVAMLPVTVLLFPWRKAVRLVTAVHGVSGDLVRVLLLARSVDRCLTAGWFEGSDPVVLEQQARLVRQAHDHAVASVDLRLLEHTVGAGLRQIKGLPQQAQLFARRAFGRSGTGLDAAPDATGAGGPGGAGGGDQLDAGVRQVEAALARPDVANILAVLDARFDAALAAG